ncbi:hypothetical protein LSM04_006987 [Trypanosoma melophagium]|uniref:uncharacterized protein n=1 Tax=Trypanosoma melophagium TaxID=715481 RepID=UPI00351A4826|nr:hypothetical protein LSM04_006987 [Trypanosoma melophagium]
MESLKTEKNEFLLRIENLRREVMGLTERMDCIGKLCKDEMDSLRDETQLDSTEVTEIRYLTPVAVEEPVNGVFSLCSQKVTQLQEQEDSLQNEDNQIRDILRVSQEQSEKLLSVLKLREWQILTALEEVERRDNVSAVEKDDDNNDDELRTWISTHNSQNTKRRVIGSSIKKDNEMKGTEEKNNPISQTNTIENKTFQVLRIGDSEKNKKYHNLGDMEPQSFLTYLHSCSNTFKHSPWRRAPYAALGYKNETLCHQHTPDRGVGLTTMPPKTWRKTETTV